MSPRRPIGRVKKLKISAAGVRVPPRAPIWVRGVISSRVRLRILWGNPWGCKSLRAHHAGLVSVEERRFRKPDVLRPNRRTSSISWADGEAWPNAVGRNPTIQRFKSVSALHFILRSCSNTNIPPSMNAAGQETRQTAVIFIKGVRRIDG